MLKYSDKPIKEPLGLYKKIGLFLSSNVGLKQALSIKAKQIVLLINEVDDIIQGFTSSVCIDCKSICCINKHSYYELSDIIYLCVIEEEIPLSRTDLSHNDPCQFLSQKGCVLKRFKRPFRCNWYFCNDLNSFIASNGKRQGRIMTSTMQSIIHTRNEMIETFFGYINSNPNADMQLIKKIIEATY